MLTVHFLGFFTNLLLNQFFFIFLSVTNKSRLAKLVHVCQKITGIGLNSIGHVCECVQSHTEDTGHPR